MDNTSVEERQFISNQSKSSLALEGLFPESFDDEIEKQWIAGTMTTEDCLAAAHKRLNEDMKHG